jgi:hypothetical protein
VRETRAALGVLELAGHAERDGQRWRRAGRRDVRAGAR